MTMLSVSKGDWETYTLDEQDGISLSSSVTLGDPITLVDEFGAEYICWDDGRFTSTDVATVAILLEFPMLVTIPEDAP